jgi:hypothetical protein
MVERAWVYLFHLVVTRDESCVTVQQDNSSRSIVDGTLLRKFQIALWQAVAPLQMYVCLDRFPASLRLQSFDRAGFKRA